MLFHEEEFTGKNGKVYTLRSPDAADAEKLISFLKLSAEETEFGLSYPEELDFSIKDEENFISHFSADKGSIMICAFDGDSLIGYAYLSCVMERKKTQHRASFGIVILKSHWAQGLGKKLLSELISFAKQAGYEQVELEVVSVNSSAISLYKKMGFVAYGEHPRSWRLKSGEYSDELLMVLDLK